jgi:hypothetical protein
MQVNQIIDITITPQVSKQPKCGKTLKKMRCPCLFVCLEKPCFSVCSCLGAKKLAFHAVLRD